MMNNDNTYLLEDWWMDDQKELVEDNSRSWKKKTFKNVQGVLAPQMAGLN
jgi:hypothetical protein